MSTTEVEIPAEVNGVNVSDVGNLVNAVQEDPDLAKSKFRLVNRWVNGGFNQSTVGGFYTAREEHQHAQEFTLTADEPPLLAGTDQAPNPVEHLLNALSACLTTALVYHAAVRGIEIEELEATLEGDLDLRGFLGVSDDVRRGYENIRVDYKVKTSAENIERLKAFSKLSPVFDTVSHGTNVAVSIEHK